MNKVEFNRLINQCNDIITKSEVLELSKNSSKEVFKEYLKKLEGLKVDILDDEIEVIGLKEYDNYFRIMIIYGQNCGIISQKLKNIYIEFIYKKKSGRLTHSLYKKFNVK